jgi:SH3 domain-containing YSC84-like protein 1
MRFFSRIRQHGVGARPPSAANLFLSIVPGASATVRFEGGFVNRLTTVIAVLLAADLAWADTAKDDVIDRLLNAAVVLQAIIDAPDKGIPAEVIRKAKCIAVIPHEVRGFFFGAPQGKGVVTCHTAEGWSAPAFFSITGGSFGSQIGLEGLDNVLMIMNQKGMERLLSNNFQIGSEPSAVAGPVGYHAAAGVDWKIDTEILSYSRYQSVFAGATLDGAAVTPDHEAMQAFYGGHAGPRQVLLGHVRPPAAAKAFLAAVAGAEERAKQAKES